MVAGVVILGKKELNDTELVGSEPKFARRKSFRLFSSLTIG